jgi:hypothetical protein
MANVLIDWMAHRLEGALTWDGGEGDERPPEASSGRAKGPHAVAPI